MVEDVWMLHSLLLKMKLELQLKYRASNLDNHLNSR